MLRNDIDAVTLAWVSNEHGPALILEEFQSKYWVKLITEDNNLVTQTRYDTLRQALTAYIEALPLDA